jgi:hypothetical protein
VKLKLKYKTVHFKKKRKWKLHDQYYVIENQFNTKIGRVLLNEFKKKYGYFQDYSNWMDDEMMYEIIDFTKQLNDENT